MLSMRQPESEPQLLVTVEEAARRLSIGRTVTYLLVLKGELPSVKIGRTRRVVVASLNDYFATLLQAEPNHGLPSRTAATAEEVGDGGQTRQPRGRHQQAQRRPLDGADLARRRQTQGVLRQ